MVINDLIYNMDEIPESEEDWKEHLNDEEYNILRNSGTEPRFSGEHVDKSQEGVYKCAGCQNLLFSSDHKFKSGTGWPSFYDVASSDNIETEVDKSHGMSRIEVKCSKCDGHLGHVFEDGPKPTGKRYCINSAALDFEEE
jgi:peptide-methionine (R)-S-oxide reductase